jgi:hypothetical protein
MPLSGTVQIDERRNKSELCGKFLGMALKQCAVSFTDVRGIRHTAYVEADSLYEAAVQGLRRLHQDPWIERFGPGTKLEVEVRERSAKHVLSVEQVERWLAGATTNPTEATKKKKLMLLLVQR